MYCTIKPHLTRTLPYPRASVSELLTPNSYSEALTDEYSDFWIQAI